MRRPLTTKRLEGFFGVLAVYGALTVLLFLPKVNVAGPAEGTYIGPKPEDIWIGAWLVLGVPTILNSEVPVRFEAAHRVLPAVIVQNHDRHLVPRVPLPWVR